MTWSLLIKNVWGWNKTCPDNKVQIIQPLTCPPAGPWWLLDVLVSLRPSRTTGTKLIGKKKRKKTTHDCLDEVAWERSRHQCGRLFSFFTLQNQQQMLQSLMWWAATHSDVHDGGLLHTTYWWLLKACRLYWKWSLSTLFQLCCCSNPCEKGTEPLAWCFSSAGFSKETRSSLELGSSFFSLFASYLAC